MCGMPTNRARTIIVLAAALGLAPLAAGCYVEESAPPPVAAAPAPDEPAVVDGYEPQYYEGYVVYYDDGGRPYYYAGGAPVFIAASSPYYGVYVNYWGLHRDAYYRWHTAYGARYRGYRHPTYRGYGGYRGGGRGYRAPAHHR